MTDVIIAIAEIVLHDLEMRMDTNKMNNHSEQNISMEAGFANHLSNTQQKTEIDINVFQKARKEGRNNPMTEDEVDAFIASVRAERHADRN